jgi:hypothetical protein
MWYHNLEVHSMHLHCPESYISQSPVRYFMVAEYISTVFLKKTLYHHVS